MLKKILRYRIFLLGGFMENSNLRKKLILIVIGFIFIISSIVCRYLSFNELPIYFLDLIGVGII